MVQPDTVFSIFSVEEIVKDGTNENLRTIGKVYLTTYRTEPKPEHIVKSWSPVSVITPEFSSTNAITRETSKELQRSELRLFW